ncbi:exopolyphosphatase [Bifidobacterium choerinum]|uniref:Exopolyphosphatase n=3 Tax=Bifidobacterium choerinum TaxID=35760 RepID=A0A087A728_9BIFI|nr:exopolyphosphatase [Bifidobacterium choerinum]
MTDFDAETMRQAQELVDRFLAEPASDEDVETVGAQLGRFPRGMVAVGARCRCGRPLAVITRPLVDGRIPFPTTMYLTSPEAVKAASHLEADGLMKEYNARLNEDEDLRRAYERAHMMYLAFRHALAMRLNDDETHIEGTSAGGMPTRVKCLHALVAQSLVMGPGVNPIGDDALERMRGEFDADVCRCAPLDEGRSARRARRHAAERAGDDARRGTDASGPSVVVAGIDCGTNSIRLKIARVDADGIHDVVPRMLRVVRLGEGVDETHRFADDALERTYAAAREFAAVLAEHRVDALRFVATSATRDAENRKEFEDTIESILGVRPEVISGTEEADLSFLAATAMTSRDDLEPPFLVVDLGGGSTELVVGGDGETMPVTKVRAAFSMNIGSVRMTERHLHSDPPTQRQIDETVADIDAHIDEAFGHVPAGSVNTIIGVSGTVTTMTALAMGLPDYDHAAVDGVRMDFATAFDVDDRFLHMTRRERGQYRTIHPGRIDVVGGGALIWSRVLERVAEAARADHGKVIDSYVASEHGLLDGLVLDMGRRLLAAR